MADLDKLIKTPINEIFDDVQTIESRIHRMMYYSLWSKLAKRDFNFPEEDFTKLCGEELPYSVYTMLADSIPTDYAIDLLNQLCKFWDETKNEWTIFTSEDVKKLSQKDFIKETHIYLLFNHPIIKDDLNREYASSKKIPRMTLIRGYGDGNVKYIDILKNTRNLLPARKSHWAIDMYKWKGFNNDGKGIVELCLDLNDS